MTLKSEIATDPLGKGYSGMTDQEVADSLNALDRTRIRTSMSGDEIFQQTAKAGFTGLSAGRQQMWVSFCARDVIDPGAAANVDFVTVLFGSPSATLAALNAARQETISRATEIGLGRVRVGHVIEAKL